MSSEYRRRIMGTIIEKNGKYRYIILEDHTPTYASGYYYDTREDAIEACQDFAEILFKKQQQLHKAALEHIVRSFSKKDNHQ